MLSGNALQYPTMKENRLLAVEIQRQILRRVTDRESTKKLACLQSAAAAQGVS